MFLQMINTTNHTSLPHPCVHLLKRASNQASISEAQHPLEMAAPAKLRLHARRLRGVRERKENIRCYLFRKSLKDSLHQSVNQPIHKLFLRAKEIVKEQREMHGSKCSDVLLAFISLWKMSYMHHNAKHVYS